MITSLLAVVPLRGHDGLQAGYAIFITEYQVGWLPEGILGANIAGKSEGKLFDTEEEAYEILDALDAAMVDSCDYGIESDAWGITYGA